MTVTRSVDRINNPNGFVYSIYFERDRFADDINDYTLLLNFTGCTLRQQSALEAFLRRKTKSSIRTTYSLCPELIAGIRIQSSNYVWEDSLNKKLRAIHISAYKNIITYIITLFKLIGFQE